MDNHVRAECEEATERQLTQVSTSRKLLPKSYAGIDSILLIR